VSGGHWGYRSREIEVMAEVIPALLEAAAESEQIVDWALSGDTSADDAARDLFELWQKTFDELYGEP
jgi:hypothetical protein